MSWTTPRTWVAGETVTASIMNSHIRDNENWLFGRTALLLGVSGAQSGSPPAFNGGLLAMQAGSDVVSYVTGGATVGFPTAFPTGLLTVIPVPGDTPSFAEAAVVSSGTSVSGFKFKAFSNTGVEIANATAIRVNWFSIGW